MFFISTCICFCYHTLLAINYYLIEKLLLAGRLYYRAGGSYSLLVRPNLTLRINHLNAWVVDNFTTVGIFFYQPYYNVISLIGLKITHPLCLLLSFLHNRIPCTHNAWEADNLTTFDMLVLSIIA